MGNAHRMRFVVDNGHFPDVLNLIMNKKDVNNISRTNWQALDSMSDEDIDYSDIPPLTEEFFEIVSPNQNTTKLSDFYGCIQDDTFIRHPQPEQPDRETF